MIYGTNFCTKRIVYGLLAYNIIIKCISASVAPSWRPPVLHQVEKEEYILCWCSGDDHDAETLQQGGEGVEQDVHAKRVHRPQKGLHRQAQGRQPCVAPGRDISGSLARPYNPPLHLSRIEPSNDILCSFWRCAMSTWITTRREQSRTGSWSMSFL